jgi:hypothetical protein
MCLDVTDLFRFDTGAGARFGFSVGMRFRAALNRPALNRPALNSAALNSAALLQIAVRPRV